MAYVPPHLRPRGGNSGEISERSSPPWTTTPVRSSNVGEDVELAPVTWDVESLVPFKRIFLQPCELSSAAEDDRIALVRCNLGVRIEEDPDDVCPPPVESFQQLGVLPDHLLWSLEYNEWAVPMPIQAQALPLILSGRDVIGIAQTGSGKTLAFLIPAVVHMEAQPPLDAACFGNPFTPLALALAPTRELAVQIADEAEKLLWYSHKSSSSHHTGGLKAACLYGGGDKRQQQSNMSRGGHLVVATPGRLIDFIKTRVLALRRVTYFVLDEADRMLDMGFREDVMWISGQVRPDRQVLFFSATWGKDVQDLALGLCHKSTCPVRISCGQQRRDDDESGGVASFAGGATRAREGIVQEVVVIETDGDWERGAAQKRTILENHLRQVLESSEEHKVLVFVSQKTLADELSIALQEDGFSADSMHGGRSQDCRLRVLDRFRKGHLRLLVCTDVLGRGIDIPSVSHVVVHEMGSIDDYIHRIGRTARGLSGKGHALVFFEYYSKLPDLAQQLINVLEDSQQVVPEGLRRIAMEVRAGKRPVDLQIRRGQGGNKWSWGYQNESPAEAERSWDPPKATDPKSEYFSATQEGTDSVVAGAVDAW